MGVFPSGCAETTGLGEEGWKEKKGSQCSVFKILNLAYDKQKRTSQNTLLSECEKKCSGAGYIFGVKKTVTK